MQTDLFQLSRPMASLLARHGITAPTQIQKEIIPAIFEGRDVLAQSETGSGKTLSFAIPLIEQLQKKDGLCVLTLVPTRELCVQVSGEFQKFSEGKHLGVTSVYGGVSINDQIRKVKSTNIIVATPGRLIDLLDRRAVNLETIKYLVLDEADRMLDMGFIHDIEKILRYVPGEHQSLLFSATISKDIEQLSRKYLKDPVNVKLDSGVKPEYLQQTYYYTTPDEKLPLLIELLKNDRELALVFCNRKHYASRIARRLSANGVHARSLHGDLTQNQRERVTDEFRKGKFTVLVATDVAARGLHIEGITHVYNYEIPRDVESYTHRVGRTARAGQKGEAISLVATPEEKKFFKDILFTYQGRINLKSFDSSSLPQLQTPQQQDGAATKGRRSGQSSGESRQQRQPSNESRQQRQSSSESRQQRQPSGPRRQSGERPGRNTPSRKGNGEHGGRGRTERTRQSGKSAGTVGHGHKGQTDQHYFDRSTGRWREKTESEHPRRSTSRNHTEQAGQSSHRHRPADTKDEKDEKSSWKKKWQKLLGRG